MSGTCSGFNMVQKRPLDDERIFVSFKHPRQVGHTKELVSFSESVFPEDGSKKPQTLENGWAKDNDKGEEKLSDDIFSYLPKGGEETSVPGSFTISSWTTSSTSEEDSLLEAPFHGSFPDCFNPERPIRTLAQSEDIYSFLLDHPPRKSVSIGPEHQADVPLWGAPGTNNNSNHLDTSEAVSNSDLEDEKQLMGTCVIPMPDSDLSADTGCIVGIGRTDCSCEDEDSVRCVRQHISEAREKLIKTIGPKRFEELGFSDMGEQVAQRWSEEEEQLFHQVVFSNPASLGKNFWDNLSTVFPSRTKEEIVSYYFNVFMLVKRAGQNRYDPINVTVTMMNGRAVMIMQILDGCYGLVDNCSTCPIAQLQDKISWDEKGDQEVQDDSCTSFDAAAASQENQLKSEEGNHWWVVSMDLATEVTMNMSWSLVIRKSGMLGI
ncbi:uncharacterized protein Pyn_37563 [Prunus yedoensis var. nudiflora]|uniref:Myb-like domain-containing protein n=1 Tax=Prunus yedoensis var. nudiflora TaxID=2094558 RepID=A0A314YS10_PRUYE|nr:uncharacterized protein Pyn_37563 [Prunus yedoensis var. nudiflora]